MKNKFKYTGIVTTVIFFLVIYLTKATTIISDIQMSIDKIIATNMTLSEYLGVGTSEVYEKKFQFEIINSSDSGSFAISSSESGEGDMLIVDSGGNVGIGVKNPSAKLSLLGNLNISNATGTSVFQVDVDSGRIGIGSSVDTIEAPLEVGNDFYVATGGEQYSQILYARYKTADSGLKQGIRVRSVAQHSSGTISNLEGTLTDVFLNSVGSIVDKAKSFHSEILTQGQINSAYHYYANDALVISGNVSTQYGYFAEEMDSGFENFAVYTDGSTKSYFGGNVGMGTNDPGSALHVNGTGNTYMQLDVNKTALSSTDCDSESERGRMIMDGSVDTLWVCTGSGGWKSTSLS